MIPFLDLSTQHEAIKKEIIQAIKRVVDSEQYILGPEVEAFEKEISEYLGVKHAIGVASGSDALLLSLMALGIKAGDEIITTPFTFFSTVSSITRLGAKPVFVDIDEGTFNMNPELIEQAITSKTKAIMPVHLFGQSCDMTKIMLIAKKNELFVIEDACQAMGAKWQEQKLGSIGDTGCFSFFPTKNLGAMGDAGLITTNNDALAEYLRKARVHGAEKKYHHAFVGINSRLDALQAAVLRVKLKHLDEWNTKRRKIAKKYDKAFEKEFSIPKSLAEAKHIYHQYALLTKNSDERKTIMHQTKEKGLTTGIYYPLALHLQKCFSDLGYKEGDFPVTEEITKRIFSLPIYPDAPYEKIISLMKN